MRRCCASHRRWIGAGARDRGCAHQAPSVHVIYVHAKPSLSVAEREGAAQLQAVGCSFTEVPHPRAASGQNKEVSRMQPLEPTARRRALSRPLHTSADSSRSMSRSLRTGTDSYERKLSHFKRRLTGHALALRHHMRVLILLSHQVQSSIQAPSLTHSHHRQSPIPFSRQS